MSEKLTKMCKNMAYQRSEEPNPENRHTLHCNKLEIKFILSLTEWKVSAGIYCPWPFPYSVGQDQKGKGPNNSALTVPPS